MIYSNNIIEKIATGIKLTLEQDDDAIFEIFFRDGEFLIVDDNPYSRLSSLIIKVDGEDVYEDPFSIKSFTNSDLVLVTSSDSFSSEELVDALTSFIKVG